MTEEHKFALFSKVFQRLMPYVRPFRARLWVGGIFTILFIGVGLLQPVPIKIVIDQVILGHDADWLPGFLRGPDHRAALLAACCLAVLSLAGLTGLFGYIRTVSLAIAGQRVVAKLRVDLHRKLLQLPLAWHGQQRSGDLLVRLSGDTVMMRNLLVEGLFALGQELLMASGVLIVIAILEPMLALMAALVVPMVVTLMYFFGKRIRAAARKQRKKEGQIGTVISEALASIPVIQSYSLEEQAAERFQKQNKKSLKAGVAATRLESKMSGWTEVSIAIGIALTLWIGVDRGRPAGAGQVVPGYLSPGELILILSFVRRLYKPMRKAVLRSSRLFKSVACGERVLEVMDVVSDLPVAKDPTPLEEVRGKLSFENVSFAYDGKGKVLDGLDLVIEPGETVALFGPNGSGKSTLASFVPRLRDVEEGRVAIDDIDVRKLDLETLRRACAFVFQDTVLFDASLRENIRLGRPEASEAEVEDAAERAGVLAYAKGFDEGLETQVGERGIALSGGQRQRIALARAILRRAKIVILDEPTAALDAESAAQFAKDLMEGLAKCTVLLVSHDQELTSSVDRVVTLEKGKIRESRPGGALVP